MTRGGAARSARAALLAFVAGCGAPRSYVADPGLYDQVPEAWLAPLAAARLAFERGDAHSAYATVAPLCLERPQLVPVRILLQELELELLSSEGKVGTLVASASEARAVLARFYEEQAEAHLRAESYVLAARLAANADEALALLDEADTLDSRCVWVHYGRAWWRHRQRRFKEARESLHTALRLDPGHLPSLRLEATMLAGAGDLEPAVDTLEVWLERTAESPLFAGAERADALLDLAALRVLLDQSAAALKLLEELDPRAVRDPVRAEEVRAAALEAEGDIGEALAAVGRAAAERPSALLPLVQRAMLLRGAGDGEGERQAWLELLARTEEEPVHAVYDDDPATIDFEAALFRLQARARLERLALRP